ncbi:hypothetical protein GN956_G4432 [Arapaima gigas]
MFRFVKACLNAHESRAMMGNVACPWIMLTSLCDLESGSCRTFSQPVKVPESPGGAGPSCRRRRTMLQ